MKEAIIGTSVVKQARERINSGDKTLWQMAYCRKVAIVRIGDSVRILESSNVGAVEDGAKEEEATLDDDE